MIFLKDKPEPNDLVFTNELGGPTCPRALTRHFERLFKKYNRQIEKIGKEQNWKQEDIEKAKLQRITFHGLRYPNLNKIQTFSKYH